MVGKCKEGQPRGCSTVQELGKLRTKFRQLHTSRLISGSFWFQPPCNSVFCLQAEDAGASLLQKNITWIKTVKSSEVSRSHGKHHTVRLHLSVVRLSGPGMKHQRGANAIYELRQSATWMQLHSFLGPALERVHLLLWEPGWLHPQAAQVFQHRIPTIRSFGRVERSRNTQPGSSWVCEPGLWASYARPSLPTRLLHLLRRGPGPVGLVRSGTAGPAARVRSRSLPIPAVLGDGPWVGSGEVKRPCGVSGVDAMRV